MPAFETYRPDAHGLPDPRCTVRPARPADVPGVLAVALSRGPQPADLGDRIERWAADPDRLVLVATAADDPAVAGWAMLARWSGHADAPEGWYVSALTVAAGHRRAGLGTRLLAGLLSSPVRRGRPVHSVVNATNLPSLALHERLGFRAIDRRSSFAGIAFTGGSGVLLRVGPGPAVGDDGTDQDEIEDEEPA